MLTEKDINIFTIVKNKNTISPLRRWCIDSWKKCMPEANIMIFDDSDLNNPNWKYYDVIKNDKLWNYYKYSKLPVPISTDSIRIRLLKAIPNALYMDSDAYLNITSKEFLELCNKYGDFNINSEYTYLMDDGKIGYFNTCNVDLGLDQHKIKFHFTFTGYFAGAKNVFLDNVIKYYDDKNINEKGDIIVIGEFLKNTFFFKEYDSIGLKFDINPRKSFITHFHFSTVRLNVVEKIKSLLMNSNIFNVLYCMNDDVWFDLSKYEKLYLSSDNVPTISFIFCSNEHEKYYNTVILLNNTIVSVSGTPFLSFYHEMFLKHIVIDNLYKDKPYKIKYYKINGIGNKRIQLDHELEDLGDDPCLLKKI